MTCLFDTHAHIDQLDDVGAALNPAIELGLVGVVAVGIDTPSNERVLELATKWPGLVHPALGLHPSELGSCSEAELAAALSFIDSNAGRAVAVGEIGLDYHKRIRATASRELQREVFGEVLSLAVKHGRPALIHSRYAWTDALQDTQSSGVRDAVFHWFTGFAGVLKGIMDAGYFISATPATEYHEEHRRAVRAVPVERLLVETDTPVWYGRDERYQSAPADILRSVRAAAEVRGMEVDEVAERTRLAAKRLFRIGASSEEEED